MLIVFVLNDALLPVVCIVPVAIACGIDTDTDDGGVITGAAVGGGAISSPIFTSSRRYELLYAVADL